LKFGKDGKENYFETLWPLPEHNCNVVNACGVHPHDDVIYCHCQNDDLNRIIRFNQAYVEYVMEVKEKSFAGTFDIDGTFYYISQSDKMYKVEDINSVKGQEPVEVFMYDVGEKYLPMDIVTAEIDLQGDGNPKRYAVGLRRDNEVHIFPLGEDCYGMEGCYELQIAPGDKVPDKAVFGAAFAYEEHLFFSDNDGVGGIYEVEFTDGKASLHVVSTNSAAHKNDGMFCYDVESPIGPLLDVQPLNPTVLGSGLREGAGPDIICKVGGRESGICDRRKGDDEWDSCNHCLRGSISDPFNHYCCTQADAENPSFNNGASQCKCFRKGDVDGLTAKYDKYTKCTNTGFPETMMTIFQCRDLARENNAPYISYTTEGARCFWVTECPTGRTNTPWDWQIYEVDLDSDRDAKSVKVNVEAYKVQLGYDTVVYGLALIGMFATAYFATQQCHKFKLQVQFDEIEQSEL